MKAIKRDEREMICINTPELKSIPRHWTMTNLQNLFYIKAGGDAKPEYYVEKYDTEHPYPVYTNSKDANSTYAYTSMPIFDGNTITVSGRGAIGQAFYRDKPYDAIIRLLSLSPKFKIEPRYYTYWINNVTQIVSYSTVIGQLSSQQLAPYKAAVPTLYEQQLIANYLDDRCSKIDAIIAEAKASIEEYKELKQAVIYEAVTKGLDKNVEMKDSGVEWVEKIPNNWHIVKITRILDKEHPYAIGDGDHGSIKTEQYRDSGIPFIRVQNLGWGTALNMDNVVYISEEDNKQIQNSTLRPNDILFAKTGATIGKTAIMPEEIPIANTTSHVGKISISKEHNSRYIFYVLSSQIGYRQFWDIAIQKTTRPELSIEETKSIKVVLPADKTIEDSIVNYLDEKIPVFDDMINTKASLIEDLEAYKKSLIYEVVTGKRKVVA